MLRTVEPRARPQGSKWSAMMNTTVFLKWFALLFMILSSAMDQNRLLGATYTLYNTYKKNVCTFFSIGLSDNLMNLLKTCIEKQRKTLCKPQQSFPSSILFSTLGISILFRCWPPSPFDNSMCNSERWYIFCFHLEWGSKHFHEQFPSLSSLW